MANVAPCGTLAAYRRHRRKGEAPCTACRKANRDIKRDQRDERRRRPAAATPTPVFPDALQPEDAPDGLGDDTSPSAMVDLRTARDALVEAIRTTAADDPTRLGPLVRELRETWKALDAAGHGASVADEDEFARARRLRAERRGYI